MFTPVFLYIKYTYVKHCQQLLLGSSDDEEILDDDSDSEIYKLEFAQHKRDYYMKKMDYDNVDE